MAPAQTFTIARRFCGPPDSGNGGYTCGRLAQLVGRPARVRLHAPPPLERPLQVVQDESERRLLDGDRLIATAAPASLTMVPPGPPTLDEAKAASARFAGFTRHAFPTCFVCGPQRAPGDGLHVFAGPLRGAGTQLVASPFTPPADAFDEGDNLLDAFVWAALDCPGYFAVCPEADRTMLLGEMSVARMLPVIEGKETLLVYAWAEGKDGRKAYAGSALATASGNILAVARSTWIEPRTS